MKDRQFGKVAILYPGNYETRQNASPENNRLAPVFQALANLGVHTEPAVYNDEFCEEVRLQLTLVDAVLVWMNPIQNGVDRSVLDSMLRRVAAEGIYVSAHPDIIRKMGTKEVLYQTRDLGWGSDTHLYRNMEQLCRELPKTLTSGKARVLKQNRGNGGIGVWKVELVQGTSSPKRETILLVRQAKRRSIEETISLDEFFTRCKSYFTG